MEVPWDIESTGLNLLHFDIGLVRVDRLWMFDTGVSVGVLKGIFTSRLHELGKVQLTFFGFWSGFDNIPL